MKAIENLIEYAEAHDVDVDFLHLNAAPAFSLQLPDGSAAIAMDPEQLETTAEERYCLAHELGHCMTGSFYSRSAACDARGKQEANADRWAARHLVPEAALRRALGAGYTERWELAELFNVPEECIELAFELYRRDAFGRRMARLHRRW